MLALAAALRIERPSAGLVIFTYYNPVLRFGLENFCDAAEQAGVDGVLVTDMIVEEAGEYLAALHRHHLAPIFLAAPTSPDARLERICRRLAGIRLRHLPHRHHRRAKIAHRSTPSSSSAVCAASPHLPIAVGFGISTPEHFAAVGEFADAAVVGSALVATIEQAGPKRAASSVAQLIQSLRGGIREPAVTVR